MNTTDTTDTAPAPDVDTSEPSDVRPGPVLRSPGTASAWTFLIAGLIGLAASMTLTVEKMLVLANPNHQLSCNINPILSCGSVMFKPQAEAFGFANSLLGIAGFTAIALVGVAILAGATMRSGFWWCVQVGVAAGAAFTMWLAFQSLYIIGALCPYCLVVWSVMTVLFIVATAGNARAGVFGVSLARIGRAGFPFAWLAILVVYALVFAAIILRFPTLV